MGINSPFLKEIKEPWVKSSRNPTEGSFLAPTQKTAQIPGKPKAGLNTLNKPTLRPTESNNSSFYNRATGRSFANNTNTSAFPYKQPLPQQPHLVHRIAGLDVNPSRTTGPLATLVTFLAQASDPLIRLNSR